MPDLCTTCRHLEREVGTAIEEVSADERRAFLFSETASGYVGSCEYAEFPELREYHGRIHGKKRDR
jgi:hypothetical protein